LALGARLGPERRLWLCEVLREFIVEDLGLGTSPSPPLSIGAAEWHHPSFGGSGGGGSGPGAADDDARCPESDAQPL